MYRIQFARTLVKRSGILIAINFNLSADVQSQINFALINDLLSIYSRFLCVRAVKLSDQYQTTSSSCDDSGKTRLSQTQQKREKECGGGKNLFRWKIL